MLERLGPAFAHLEEHSVEQPNLTVNLWDAESSGVEPPVLPALDPNDPRGAFFYAGVPPHYISCQPGLSVLNALDVEQGVGWFWCRAAEALPFWELAAPIRQILHWWLSERDLLLLHGAAVGMAEGGVLLVGPGGSGKSTCALSSLGSDLLYAGDDYVAARCGADPWIYSLYSSGKLVPGHARLLSHLPPPTHNEAGADDEKAVFYVHERFPERLCRGFPLRAVLVPRVTGTSARIVPLKPVDALRALAPSTLLQMRPALPEAFATMARLLERVPTFAFEVGGDTAEIPRAIEQLLADLPG